MADRIQSRILVAAMLATTCCSIPHAGGIRSALDESDHEAALDLALENGRSLDFLAMEIIRRGLEDGETRDAALSLLGRSGSRARPLLRDLAAGSGDPVVRATAQSLLHRQGDRTWEDDLVLGLDSDLGLVRAAAVEALLEHRQPRSFHEHYLLDTDPAVRRAVIAYMASEDLPWSQELLLDAARKDPDPAARAAAVRALDARLEDNTDTLREALGSTKKPLRLAAVQSLGRVPETAELTWTAHLVSVPVTTEGIHYCAALLRADDEHAAATDYLEEAVADPSPTIRLAALVALTGIPADVEGTDALASDPSDAVRVAWCRLTRKLGTSKRDERLGILGPIVEKEDAGPDALIAMAREKNGYEAIRARVWWMLASGDEAGRRYVVVHAIRPFDDPPLALRGMKDESARVRLDAALAWLSRK